MLSPRAVAARFAICIPPQMKTRWRRRAATGQTTPEKLGLDAPFVP
jgi:hypothetical protein